MSKISKAFEQGKAFIPFITCGDPDLSTTEQIVREAVRNGGIEKTRYDSYLKLYEKASQIKLWELK